MKKRKRQRKQRTIQKPQLKLELIPATTRGINIRTQLPHLWPFIRSFVFHRANWACEICGARGDGQELHCHEVFHYDRRNLIQELIGFESLCPLCHMVKHFGWAGRAGKTTEALEHLMKIKGYGKPQARRYVSKKFRQYRKIRFKEWKIDLSYAERHFKMESPI